MKIVLLVGNGFDIGLGLKTKYTDFVTWYLDRDKESNGDEVGNLKKWIKRDMVNWSDAEMAFAHAPFKRLASGNKKFNRFLFDLLKSFKESLRKYLRIAESEFHYERITPEIRSVFRCNVISSIIEGISPESRMILQEKFAKENNELTVLNFNYTKTLDKLIWDEGDPKEFEITLGDSTTAHFILNEVLHPHGILERGDILFGVSDPEMLSDSGAKEFSRLTGFLAKPNTSRENGSGSVDSSFHAMFESKMVVVFGMSLGESDIVWWENIRESLSLSKDHIVYFNYSSEPFKIRDDGDWKLLKAEGRKNFFRTCKPRMDSTDQMSLDNCIHKVDIAHYGPYRTNLSTPRFCDPFDLEWLKSMLTDCVDER